MKIKTVISSICLTLLVVAYLMEGDVLRDMEIEDSGNAEIKMGEAVFALKTSLPSLGIKSLSDAGTLSASMDEAEINNCTLMFFGGTQVSSIIEGLFVDKGNCIVKTKDGAKDDWAEVILKVKKPSPYSAIVIANSSKSFTGYRSEDNIKDIIQDGKDALVRVGGVDISFDTDFAGYPTIAEALGKPLEVGTVPLSQLATRIELTKFNVLGFQGAFVKEEVTITGTDLLNLDPKSHTINEQTYKDATYLFESGTCSVGVYSRVPGLPSTYFLVNNRNPLSFYFFRNLTKAESDQIRMQVRFKIRNNNEGRTTRPFMVDKEGSILHDVKSGYVYRLVVSTAIIGDKVEAELLCYTRDRLNSTISIPMEDNCKRVE